MRVISGTARGKKLVSLEGEHTRPTTDRVKESLFNLIFDYIYDARVLDLFSGSGALGVEALSRGARQVTFTDNFKEALSVTKKNVEAVRCSDKAEILLCDALEFLQKTNKKYDVIFADPPYKAGLCEQILILAKNALADDGILVYESDEPVKTELYDIIKERKYGKTFITILKEK